MPLILVHILLFALSFIAIYFGFKVMIKYFKKTQKYRSDKPRFVFCLGMIVLAFFVMLSGLYLLYAEIDSFIQANS